MRDGVLSMALVSTHNLKLFLRLFYPAVALLIFAVSVEVSFSQEVQDVLKALGSKTAKNGFRNETEVAAKFDNWKTDDDAKVWLAAMGYKPGEIESVTVTEPNGEKADVLVRIKTNSRERTEGISIKLVSNPNGFNQIDKRWLSNYAKMWQMPADVVESLRLFTGEVKPTGPSRSAQRMFLDELAKDKQKAVIDFFNAKKNEIVSDLFKGDGAYSAGWMMVALKSSEKPRWVLRRIDYAIEFFSRGDVSITSGGNLRIGRITMQRKGGDAGRETAKMLQFKINPAILFN